MSARMDWTHRSSCSRYLNDIGAELHPGYQYTHGGNGLLDCNRYLYEVGTGKLLARMLS